MLTPPHLTLNTAEPMLFLSLKRHGREAEQDHIDARMPAHGKKRGCERSMNWSYLSGERPQGLLSYAPIAIESWVAKDSAEIGLRTTGIAANCSGIETLSL